MKTEKHTPETIAKALATREDTKTWRVGLYRDKFKFELQPRAGNW